jgi:putative Mg2+ transporter-C (MgtC) family protein
MWEWHFLLATLGKLALAALIGGAVGFEREAHGQAAGLRTNILVAVGACLMMQLSLNMESLFRHLTEDSVVRLDPGRIASYAIASMGFLGAGAIITGKGSVRGLTTAAGLWLVTGICLAIGAGFLAPALFAAFISLICLFGMRMLKTRLHRITYTILTIKCQGLKEHLDLVRKILAEGGVNTNFVTFQRNLHPDMTTYRLHLESKENIPWGNIVENLSTVPDLIEFQWQEGEVP